jgi:selenoprotein W-related protein
MIGKMNESKPEVEIVYCAGCRWLLRAGWIAQELLTTFEKDLGAVRLVPGSGGMFEVRLTDGTLLWSREHEGRLPDLKDLKHRLRDRIDPERNLGHSDRS